MHPSKSGHAPRRRTSAALAAALLALPMLTQGCATSNFSATALLAGKPVADDANSRQSDAVAQTLQKARTARIAGHKSEALAMLDQIAPRYPGNTQLKQQRGLLALELGQVSKAERLLRKVIGAGAADWRVLSGLGAALAAQGKHQSAQSQFKQALAQRPNNPAILNNLALSYAMAGKLRDSERLLRQVVAMKSPAAQVRRAKQNLALVLGFQGRLKESRHIASSTMPAATARANADYLKYLASRKQVSRADPDQQQPAPRLARLPQ